MKNKVVVGVLAVVALAACDSGTEPPAGPGEVLQAVSSSFGSLAIIPDPGDASAFNDVVGEKVIVCKVGPTHAGFYVSDGTSTEFVEVAPDDCRVVYAADGETKTVTVRERVPADQRIASVQMTQLTCGRGLGVHCDPATSPAVTGPVSASNPVSGFVGGTGPSPNRSQWGRAGYVVEFTNEFALSETPIKPEHAIVCIRGVSRATVVVSDGTQTNELRLRRGCHTVYAADGATRTVTIRQAAPAGYSVAAVYQKQLTCGKGIGVECDPSDFPTLTGPSAVANPTTGFVGGSGPSSSPSQKGQAGFVVEFFNVRG